MSLDILHREGWPRCEVAIVDCFYERGRGWAETTCVQEVDEVRQWAAFNIFDGRIDGWGCMVAVAGLEAERP